MPKRRLPGKRRVQVLHEIREKKGAVPQDAFWLQEDPGRKKSGKRAGREQQPQERQKKELRKKGVF